jgi:deazaflavin-dependent oxidoreductase (nitroreductase family)
LTLLRIIIAANTFLFQISDGRLGNRMSGQPLLLLRTVGRKTGKTRITPLAYYRDGDDYIVVASNWGKEKNPNWFRNLMRQPRASIQIENKNIPVQAQEAQGEGYARLWQMVTGLNRHYEQYQMMTPRHIPVVILTPVTETQREQAPANDGSR